MTLEEFLTLKPGQRVRHGIVQGRWCPKNRKMEVVHLTVSRAIVRLNSEAGSVMVFNDDGRPLWLDRSMIEKEDFHGVPSVWQRPLHG